MACFQRLDCSEGVGFGPLFKGFLGVFWFSASVVFWRVLSRLWVLISRDSWVFLVPPSGVCFKGIPSAVWSLAGIAWCQCHSSFVETFLRARVSTELSFCHASGLCQVDADDSVLCGVELQEIRMEHTTQAGVSSLQLLGSTLV